MGADDDIGALNATTTAEKIEPDAGKSVESDEEVDASWGGLHESENKLEFFLNKANDVFVVYRCRTGHEPIYECKYFLPEVE